MAERLGGVGAVLADELDRARAAGEAGRTVALVEGVSDQRALETLARRAGRDLDAEDIAVIPIAGATNISRFLELLGPGGFGVGLGGLCDEGEEDDFRAALATAGLGSRMEELGFFVCHGDLEEELIRALGADGVLAVMESQGHSRAFHSFRNQPAQRHKTVPQQLWRWMGNHKIKYAPLLVDALDLDDVPRPLRDLLDHLVRYT